MIPAGEIRKLYLLLETIKKDTDNFRKAGGKGISFRGFEDKYGEYFVANWLLDNGYGIDKININKGIDLILSDGRKIEVKTSKWTRRFKGGKIGYGWSVKKKQWYDQRFDFLVCIALSENVKPMVFSHSEVVEKFIQSSFKWQDGRYEKDARVLDIIKGNSDGLVSNFEAAKERINWSGIIPDFVKDVNDRSEYYFEHYGFNRLFALLSEKGS